MSKRKIKIKAAALWGSLTCLSAGGVGCCTTNCGGHDGGGGAGGGIHDGFNKCADIPKGALPAELGAFQREFIFRHAAKAEADDFVIYQYEWLLDTPDLGPFGRRHLAAASRRLETDAPFGIIIEASSDPKIDEARYLVITDILGQLGIKDPATRVRLGVPGAEGLFGDEAARIYSRGIVNDSGGVGGYGGYGGYGAGGYGGFGGYGGGYGGYGGAYGGGAPGYGGYGGFGGFGGGYGGYGGIR